MASGLRLHDDVMATSLPQLLYGCRKPVYDWLHIKPPGLSDVTRLLYSGTSGVTSSRIPDLLSSTLAASLQCCTRRDVTVTSHQELNETLTAAANQSDARDH